MEGVRSIFLGMLLFPITLLGQTFWRGADISWYTEMEADGRRFYNRQGEERSCPALMKELGMNAIRLRVWVDPSVRLCHFCHTTDVVAKAKAAKALGMDVLIDFHYSDWWADPGRQDIPAGWTDHTVSALQTAVADHTREVLTALKEAGVTPRWVQVGNETNSGMLLETGRASDTSTAYAQLFQSGARAAREVFPNVQVIAHLANGYDQSALQWNLSLLQKGGVGFDVIGISCYPSLYRYWSNGKYVNVKYWSETEKREVTLASAADYIRATFESIDFLAARFGVPVMICETGVPVSDVTAGTQLVTDIMTRARGNAHCQGAFYWEPQCEPSWRPSSYVSWGWNAYDMGAFQNGRPTAILDAFSPTEEEQLTEPVIPVQAAANKAPMYDLLGRPVTSPYGFYICNGRVCCHSLQSRIQ